MATAAITSYGIELRLGDGIPSTAGVITSATNATPIIITTVTPHGVVDVSYATVAGVVGNTGANGSWVVEAISATQLKLRQSAGNGTYSSGGTIVLESSFATMAELRNLSNMGVRLQTEDVTAHDGDNWTSELPILLQGMPIQVTLNFVGDDPTHDGVTGLIHLALLRLSRPFLVVVPDATKTTIHFRAWVTDHPHSFPIGALQTQATLSLDGRMTLSLA